MTPDPLDKIRTQLLAGIDEEPSRRKRRRVGAAAAVAVILGAVGLALAAPWQDDVHDAVIAGEVATGGTTVPDAPPPSAPSSAGAVWAIEQPAGWDRAGRELMPNLGWDSRTVASFDLRPGGEQCAHLPEQALRDMGADDALFSVFFTGPAAPAATPWPETGDLGEVLPAHENHPAHECADRNDLRIHWGDFERAGVGMYVLVAFGPDAGDELAATTWNAVSSLRPRDDAERAQLPVCVVTMPGDDEPTLPTPPGYDTPPGTGHAWYGTPDLWTWLPSDGRHAQRKSVWLSGHYPGGAVEPEPTISTTWQRLDDQTTETIDAGPAGTPAHGTATDAGGPIIAGIDPLEAGCWEVTATYKGHELSYVYWHPTVTVPDVVGLEVASAQTELTRAGHLPGRVDDVDAPFDFALVVAQEPPAGAEVPSGAPVGLRTALPDPPEQRECPGTSHPRDSESADALPSVESVTRSRAAEAWATLPDREVDGARTHLGKWDRHAWQRNDAGEVEIVPVDGYQLVAVHESAGDCPDGPPSAINGVPVTHWILPTDAGG